MSTRAQILAEIAAQFPDNTTGLITPAKLRQVVEDVTNSCLVSETDAGTAGKAVLTAETQAQVRAAAGFGGTVTVAQLNAAGADARSAMYYCSDCLTVNGPGSLVAWCGRTSTWRTLDDCLLATTYFAEWAIDYMSNSNSSEIRGIKGGLFRGFDTSQAVTFAILNSSSATTHSTSTMPYPHRRFGTGTNANGYGRASGVSLGGISTGTYKLFCGLRRVLPAGLAGVTMRVGLTTLAAPTNVLSTSEHTLCLDSGNVLGALNPGLSTNYCACIRNLGTNLTGSGETAAAASIANPHDLLVVRDLNQTRMYVNKVAVAEGSSPATSGVLYPFAVFSNDGVSTSSTFFDFEDLVFGYMLP